VGYEPCTLVVGAYDWGISPRAVVTWSIFCLVALYLVSKTSISCGVQEPVIPFAFFDGIQYMM
jgi:hypothetical protein